MFAVCRSVYNVMDSIEFEFEKSHFVFVDQVVPPCVQLYGILPYQKLLTLDIDKRLFREKSLINICQKQIQFKNMPKEFLNFFLSLNAVSYKFNP